MRSRLFLILTLFCAAPSWAAHDLSVEPSGAVLTNSPLHLRIIVDNPPPVTPVDLLVSVDGNPIETITIETRETDVKIDDASLGSGHHTVSITSADSAAETRIRALPAWLSILPPLIAICLALVFKDVLVSLYMGIFSGALILSFGNPIAAFARSIDTFIVSSLADSDNASILIFSCLLGGMVGLISRSGGTQGIVERLKPYATSSQRGQVATWLMGILVFFDDYANTLIVGSTMRPISDRLRISREKLAYIVDSTAAPVASVFPISTWIGFEVGLIAAAFTQLDLPFSAYGALVASIPYRFYPIFALILGFTVAITGRDMGPMLKAERRANSSGKVIDDGAVPLADYASRDLIPPEGTPKRAINALVPILAVIGVTIGGIYVSGSAGLDRADYSGTVAWLREVFTEANSFHVLLWASLVGMVLALLLPLVQRILSLRQGMEAMVGGIKSMLLALVVLILAWSIGAVCTELHTADFVVQVTQGQFAAYLLPVLIFLVSAAVSFATGTSWGTMAILMPLVIPICHALCLADGYAVGDDAYYRILLGTISSVLAGSVWGDHCSPISDTTILSSMATGCDHIAHVRTQLPYAITIGVLSMLLGDVATALGLSPWIAITIGAVLIVFVITWRGQRST